MQLKVTTNIQDVIDRLNAAAKETRPAVMRALNKMVARIKVRAARAVLDSGYKLQIKDIKKAIKINRANSARLRAEAVASGRLIPLIKYNARPIGAGVSVDVMNGRKTVSHAFIATMPNGHKGVFERYGPMVNRAGRKYGQSKQHQRIRELFGPGIPDALANKAVAQAMVDLIGKDFPPFLEHELEWLANGLPKRSTLPTE